MITKLEGQKPAIGIDIENGASFGKKEVTVTITDVESGLRRVWIALLSNGKETVLEEKEFPAEGLTRVGDVKETSFTISIDPKKMKSSDGAAVVRMVAVDYSWRRWFDGNRSYEEREVLIDTRPPFVDVLSRAHNLTKGGSCLAIYRLSESCTESGVRVGDAFFPGYSGYFADKNIFLAFFALSYKQGRKTEIFLTAEDLAGNRTRAGLPYYIRNRSFKKDVINVSDSFLNSKTPEFTPYISAEPDDSPVAKYIKVNRDLRRENYETIQDITRKNDLVLYWKGAFKRLPKSATRAKFADHRDYRYKGKVIDHQVHMGVDLASLSHSPVPAANAGVIVFSDYLGIYGKTVIIDHGFGLFSLYAHLSRIEVEPGVRVKRGEKIGRTGKTGLAGGDHLHFSMLVRSTFVDPVEWWDPSWIKNNITSKLEEAAADG
ncbi:MAG: M23 family metallopeptidase [Desulfobacterales bacterium]|nr:M23 family metallopeptidase [Desulfobacterales bacterium]